MRTACQKKKGVGTLGKWGGGWGGVGGGGLGVGGTSRQKAKHRGFGFNDPQRNQP